MRRKTSKLCTPFLSTHSLICINFEIICCAAKLRIWTNDFNRCVCLFLSREKRFCANIRVETINLELVKSEQFGTLKRANLIGLPLRTCAQPTIIGIVSFGRLSAKRHVYISHAKRRKILSSEIWFIHCWMDWPHGPLSADGIRLAIQRASH